MPDQSANTPIEHDRLVERFRQYAQETDALNRASGRDLELKKLLEQFQARFPQSDPRGDR